MGSQCEPHTHKVRGMVKQIPEHPFQGAGGYMAKQFLKVSEAAELLGITQKAARHRIARGELPYRRWGKRLIIPLKELEAFLQQLPGQGTQEALVRVEELT